MRAVVVGFVVVDVVGARIVGGVVGVVVVVVAGWLGRVRVRVTGLVARVRWFCCVLARVGHP
jgi:hypothetical protein